MDYLNIELWVAVGTLFTAIIGAVWKQGTWLAKQFSDLKDFVNDKVDGVLDKLEYHERHDDQRFAAVDDKFTVLRNDIWMLRLDNAQSAQNQSRNVRRETSTPGES